MTALKIKGGKLTSAAADALEPYKRKLYADQGARIVGVIELAHEERSEPAPDVDKEPCVTLRISHLEIANPEQENALREAQRVLFLHRTASGTLDEDGELRLSRGTLERTAGLLGSIEAARLRAGLAHWAGYARRVVSQQNLTQTEIRHELDSIADGLWATLRAAERGDDALPGM